DKTYRNARIDRNLRQSGKPTIHWMDGLHHNGRRSIGHLIPRPLLGTSCAGDRWIRVVEKA
ncbi:MAG: hypothetical protein ACK57Y_08230, partial [Pirellulaceae bacterium]